MKNIVEITPRTQRFLEIILILATLASMIVGTVRAFDQLTSRLDVYQQEHTRTSKIVADIESELTKEVLTRQEEYAKLNLKITEVEERLTTGQNWIIMLLTGEVEYPQE